VFDADKMRRLWLAACLLNVRLALHPANVLIAHGRNVAASAVVQRSLVVIIISAAIQSRLLFCRLGILLELSANHKGDSTTPDESRTPIEPQIAKDTREQRRTQRPCRVHRCARYEG
jgi:hypothetical protein